MNKKNIFIGVIVLLVLSLTLVVPPVFATGAGSMIAIIVTTHDPNLESKLAAYDAQFGLPACTVENGCLEIATPYGISNSNPSSNSDMSPFVGQAHQSAPGAKILVVEAKSTSWYDKYDAANYAITLPEVAKVSSVSNSKVVMIIGLVLK